MWKRLLRTKHLTVVLDTHARGGRYSPEIHVHRSGKNGSPNGFGPKLFPAWLLWITRSWREPYDFGGMLVSPVPHIRWRYPRSAMRSRLYQWNYAALARLVKQ